MTTYPLLFMSREAQAWVLFYQTSAKAFIIRFGCNISFRQYMKSSFFYKLVKI